MCETLKKTYEAWAREVDSEVDLKLDGWMVKLKIQQHKDELEASP